MIIQKGQRITLQNTCNRNSNDKHTQNWMRSDVQEVLVLYIAFVVKSWFPNLVKDAIRFTRVWLVHVCHQLSALLFVCLFVYLFAYLFVLSGFASLFFVVFVFCFLCLFLLYVIVLLLFFSKYGFFHWLSRLSFRNLCTWKKMLQFLRANLDFLSIYACLENRSQNNLPQI